MPVLASLPVHATFVPPIGLYSDLLSSAYLGLAGYAALPVNIILCFLVFAFMGVFVFQTQTQTRLQKSSWSSSAFTTIPTVVTSLIEKQFQRKHYRSFGRRPVNQRRRIIPYTRLLFVWLNDAIPPGHLHTPPTRELGVHAHCARLGDKSLRRTSSLRNVAFSA